MKRVLNGMVLAGWLAAGSAQAVIVNMGVDPVDEFVVNSFAAGTPSFTDTVLFSVSAPSGLVSTAFSNWSGITAGLRNLTLTLFQGAAVIASEGPSSVVPPSSGVPAFTLESLSETLAAGNYRLVLAGDVRPDGGFYSWTVSTTLAAAPIPEPEQWALMVLGIAVAGFGIRRQRRGLPTA